jgi:hypothetical protein
MKNFDKHAFDELLRTGFPKPDLSEIDEDWELMKARLQKGKRRAGTYYLLMTCSAAAVLLLVLAVLFNYRPALDTQVASENENRPVERTTDASLSAATRTPVRVNGADNNANTDIASSIALRPHSSDQSSWDRSKLPVVVALDSMTSDEADTISALALIAAVPVSPDKLLPDAVKESDSAATGNESIVVADTEEVETGRFMGEKSVLKSRFSLALTLSPDLNGVEGFQSEKVSYSIGAGLIYHISPRLAVEAGAAYGRKNYQTGFSFFKPLSYNLFQIKPNMVSSGFDIMDIQLNMGYTLFEKDKVSIGVGGGVSSYLMLDEYYSFSYQNLNARGLSSFSTGYQRNHFFGVANLNLSYKQSLTNKVKLFLNPFLKLPLTDLGYGNIRLRSAGMSLGVITDLGKDKK